ncbi:MAG: hypothetical protein JWL81_1003, partial [Verrucomicrobiales bacterium]|nr:hypothetical protein [Verrucomicrobiales bacterium]
GTHTLAVSVHQSAADSSDKGFALTFYGRAATGVSLTPVLGAVTRNLNNTLTTDDDTFRFAITVNAVSGGAAGWTSDGVPASGLYGVSNEYGPFPVSESPKILTFTDSVDVLAKSSITVTPPPIFGLTNFGGTPAAVGTTLPLPANWTANGAIISHSSNVGVATPGTTLASETVNLASVSGPVLLSMNLNLADTSATTNFEANDTVLVELVLNPGAGEQRVNLISPHDFNGNGVLNGFTAADAAAYNVGKIEDELNGAGLDAEASVNHTFPLSAVIPDNITSARIEVTSVTLGGSETVTVSNVLFSAYTAPDNTDTDKDGQTDAAEIIAGTNPANPADYLRIANFAPNPGGGMDLSFPSKLGINYRLEVSTLLTGGWVPYGEVIAGSGADIAANLPQLPIAGNVRFFVRLRVVP